MDPYTELKELPALKGSLNAIVSQRYNLRRPFALSESDATSDINMERAVAHFTPSELPPVIEEDIGKTELFIVNNSLRFLFHINLISVFETVFFFLYISTLEDSGITKTINYFITSVVSSCRNLTHDEQVIANVVLRLFINTTNVADDAIIAYQSRRLVNHHLFQQAWAYVGIISGCFILLTIYSRFRRIPVAWMTLFLENIGLVTLLAAYEYMFFTTIIMPFKPLSAQEISENAVTQLQSSCGLLT